MSDLTKDWRTNDEQIVVDRLNAEIERLKREDKLNQSHNAEIERLRELDKLNQSHKDLWQYVADTAKRLEYDNKVREGHLDQIFKLGKDAAQLRALISELADALTSQDRPATRPFLREDHELIQRARERVAKRPINP
jgi:hypothetical protein